MKILLVDAGRGYIGAASGGGTQGNLGLEYLASFVQSKGHEVVVLEPPLDDISDEEVVIEAGKVDAIGISCMIWNAYKANAMASEIRKRFPQIRLAVGGNGPTGMPEYFTDYFNTVILGEGEKPFLEWLEGRDERKIITASRDLEWDGNIFPLRKKEIMRGSRMRGIWPLPYAEQVVTNAIYSKGCYGRCSFCSSPLTWQQKVVWRDPESVAEELIMLSDKFGVNSVDMIDATFNANNSKILDLCKTFLKRGINKKIKWTAMISPSRSGAEEIFPAMAKAGCVKVGMGLEDPLPQMRKQFAKNGNPDICRETFEAADRASLLVRVYLIIGAPNQTEANIEATKDALRTWPIDEPRISIFTPFPGTKAWAEFQNEITEWDFKKYDTNNPVIKSAWSNDELLGIRSSLTQQFYAGDNYRQRREKRIRGNVDFQIAYEQFESTFLKPKGYI